jgi:hypothetical protein
MILRLIRSLIKHKLVEKNNTNKLDAAKRTIAKLEVEKMENTYWEKHEPCYP